MDDGIQFQETLAPGGQRSGERKIRAPPEVLTQDDERRFADPEAQDDLGAPVKGQSCELYKLEAPATF